EMGRKAATSPGRRAPSGSLATRRRVMQAPQNYLAVIKVVGVGGGGTNAVNRMVEAGLKGVEFIAMNTDAQALLVAEADVNLGIGERKSAVDTLIVVPNDRLLQVSDAGTPMVDAFRMADQVLYQGVDGITSLIITPGLINLDFADVKAVMTGAGSALMGIGHGSGEGRAEEAARSAISSPLLESSIEGAKGVLLAIAGPSDLALHEVNRAAETITKVAHPDANIIFGAVIDDALGDGIRVTVIAAGFDKLGGNGRNGRLSRVLQGDAP